MPKTYSQGTTFHFDPRTDPDVLDAVANGGFEQEEIARRMGVTRQSISQTLDVATRKLRRTCERMGISLQDLLQPERVTFHD